MAHINVEIENDVEISVKEFYEEMDEREKEEMLELLTGKSVSSGDDEKFDSEVMKLVGNRWRLSLEDEAAILRITNKIA
jgi:hypothetical protein